MPTLRLNRPTLISADESTRIHRTALKILEEIGLEVFNPDYLNRLKKAGLRISANRVYLEPHVVEGYVEEQRRVLASRPAQEESSGDLRLTLSVSSYCLNVHDLGTGQVVPYSIPRLVEMTRFMDSFYDEGVYGAPPGIPAEVPPHLQPLAQYRIAALYCRQGATPVDPTSARTIHPLLDMAEVMGQPIRHLPVYMPTPLRLGGESLDVVMACLDRIEHIGISSMPATGTTAPLQPFGALALAVAEVMGGMVCVSILTGKSVSFYPAIFPSDLREGAMVFGSPENMLLQMLGDDFARFYGWQPGFGPDNLHDMAKLPDCQSAVEKSAILVSGALLGSRHFTGAGTLSLDEIFSPEQLLVDVEARDWAQRAIQGVDLGETDVTDWVEEIRQGIQEGFIRLDSTLDHYRLQTWYPKRFLRGPIGPWMVKGQPRQSEGLKQEVQRRILAHRFELEQTKRVEIERIYQRAEELT